MSDHLSPATLTALVDGELTRDQLVYVNGHLAGCPRCTSSALAESLVKSATGKAGQRYAPPPELCERLERMASLQAAPRANPSRAARRFNFYAWVAAAALLLMCISLLVVERSQRNGPAEIAGLVTEACDQHIAMLAANSPPEVISSDRHTVKPWFQGKLPFSFNLPQNLPADSALDGANLTYLHNQPAAQLLYSIGKHRVSIFVRQGTQAAAANGRVFNRAGFHVTEFRAEYLDVLAVSDVEPTRLSALVSLVGQAQTESGTSTMK